MTWTLLYRAASGVIRKLQENPGDQALLSQLQEVFNQASEAGMEENVKTVFSAPLAALGITLEQKKGGKGKRMPASPSTASPSPVEDSYWVQKARRILLLMEYILAAKLSSYAHSATPPFDTNTVREFKEALKKNSENDLKALNLDWSEWDVAQVPPQKKLTVLQSFGQVKNHLCAVFTDKNNQNPTAFRCMIYPGNKHMQKPVSFYWEKVKESSGDWGGDSPTATIPSTFSAPLTEETKKQVQTIAFPPYKPYHPPQPTLPVILGDGSDPFKAMVVLVEEAAKNPKSTLVEYPGIKAALIAAFMGDEKGAAIPLAEHAGQDWAVKNELNSELQYKGKTKKHQKAQEYLRAWLKAGNEGKLGEIVDNLFERRTEALQIRHKTPTKEQPFAWSMLQPFPLALAEPVLKERLPSIEEVKNPGFMRDPVSGAYLLVATLKLEGWGNTFTAMMVSKVHKEGRTGYLPGKIHGVVNFKAALPEKWHDHIENASTPEGSPYESEAFPVLNQALIYLHESPPKYRATGWPENWPVG